MPYQSKSQHRAFRAMEARGELPKGTSSRWAHHTKSMKKLPEKKKKSAAYSLGESLAKEAGPMAWMGRKAVMPAIRGIAGPIEKLLSKLKLTGAAGKLGKYRKGLLTDIGITPTSPADELLFGPNLKRQRLYGGIGTAAVGIPALAAILGGVSGGRRRKAEREMEMAMAKGAMRGLGERMVRPTSALLDLVGAKGSAGRLRKAKEIASGAIQRPSVEEVGKSVKAMKRLGYGTAGAGAGAAGTALGVSLGVKSHKKKKEKKEKEKKSGKEAQLGTPFMDGFLLQCAEAGLNQAQAVDLLEKAAEKDDRTGKECKAFLERVAACKE